MNKLTYILCIAILLLNCSNDRQIETTEIGMFTPYSYFPQTVNNKVKEVKETNFLPIEKEGKIATGAPLTAADRDSINWTQDFTVQFNESGLAVKVFDTDENGKITGTWEIDTDVDVYKTAKRIVNETLTILDRITKLNDNTLKFEIIDPETDTLRSKLVLDFGENNKYRKLQWYNFKGEPTAKYDYSYDSEGLLLAYTYSRNDTVWGGMNFTNNEIGFFETQEIYNIRNKTSEITRYEYEYDKAGNWIKAIAFINDKPLVVSLREYTYY